MQKNVGDSFYEMENMITSSTESDESSNPESTPWQDMDNADYEEHIAQTINDWLAQHGKALFALETSKYLVKINKEMPKTPRKQVIPAHDSQYWEEVSRDHADYVKSFHPGSKEFVRKNYPYK